MSRYHNGITFGGLESTTMVSIRHSRFPARRKNWIIGVWYEISSNIPTIFQFQILDYETQLESTSFKRTFHEGSVHTLQLSCSSSLLSNNVYVGRDPTQTTSGNPGGPIISAGARKVSCGTIAASTTSLCSLHYCKTYVCRCVIRIVQRRWSSRYVVSLRW